MILAFLWFTTREIVAGKVRNFGVSRSGTVARRREVKNGVLRLDRLRSPDTQRRKELACAQRWHRPWQVEGPRPLLRVWHGPGKHRASRLNLDRDGSAVLRIGEHEVVRSVVAQSQEFRQFERRESTRQQACDKGKDHFGSQNFVPVSTQWTLTERRRRTQEDSV